MTPISAAKPRIVNDLARLAEWHPKEIDLRMNEYSFTIILWNCEKLKTCSEAVRR
ncbi:MAG: hypothetical protein OEL78_07400 [Hyphomicrobiales bacterium]|nr:hypothetical protein [Hyphomicrobiales bacterium]